MLTMLLIVFALLALLMLARFAQQPVRRLAMVVLAFVLFPSFAFAAEIDAGPFVNYVLPILQTVVAAAVSTVLGWILYEVKKRFSVQMDDSMRASLETFLKNRASGLVAAGAVKVQDAKIMVSSDMLAAAANESIKYIPDALNHFGLTQDVIAKKIVAAIPQVPAMAGTSVPTT